MKIVNPSSTIRNPHSAYRALSRVVRFDSQGLIPTVIQAVRTRRVLTLCYLNRAALKKSLNTGTVYVFRRSQRRLMQKGETSGHIQLIRRVLVDCEGQSLVFQVQQRIGACHAGYVTCYFRGLSPSGRLSTVERKVFDPGQVYRPLDSRPGRGPGALAREVARKAWQPKEPGHARGAPRST